MLAPASLPDPAGLEGSSRPWSRLWLGAALSHGLAIQVRPDVSDPVE